MALLLLAVTGLCRLAELAMGPDEVSRFKSVDVSPRIAALVSGNATAYLGPDPAPDEAWHALQPTLQLLEAANPDIAAWLSDLHARNRIVHGFRLPIDHPAYEGSLAFQSPVIPYLMLSPGFYAEPDIDKAAILAHEFRHSRQNFAKVVGERAWQGFTLKVFFKPDDTRLEDEAYLYQSDFYKAYGLRPSWLEYLLRERGLT